MSPMNLTSSGSVALTRSTPVWQRIFPLSQWGTARAAMIRMKEARLSRDASPYHAFLNHPGILVGAGHPPGVRAAVGAVDIFWTLGNPLLQGRLFRTHHFKVPSSPWGPFTVPVSTACVYYNRIRKSLQRQSSPDSAEERVTEGRNPISPTRLMFQPRA